MGCSVVVFCGYYGWYDWYFVFHVDCVGVE